MENPVQLTPRFTLAVDYTRQVHVSLRKGTQVPYMAHLLGVASLVLGETGHVPFPVTEDMAIAALLHDAVEDEGGLPRLRDIEAKFGNKVAKIVEGCTDSFEQDANKKVEDCSMTFSISESQFGSAVQQQPQGHPHTL
jgi:(p)ppGpp synthase/HD superfamily hydrolase